MTLAPLQRRKIFQALLEYRKNYQGSQTDFCKVFGINQAIFSQIKKALAEGGAVDKLVADDKLVVIGRRLSVSFSSEAVWKVGNTETYEYITAALEYCQANSIARMFVDIADIGKSTAAKQYMLSKQNVFYLDCSQTKGKTEFIRAMAKVVGVDNTGSVKDVYRDTCYMVQAMDRPIFILDEAGDLSYGAFLEIKSYWNSLEGACGWYMMGADGLAKKMQANINAKKVGYAEIYRRFGGEIMSITGKMNPAEVAMFRRRQIDTMAYVNVPQGTKYTDFTNDTLSLTRAKENLRKAERSNLFNQQKEAK